MPKHVVCSKMHSKHPLFENSISIYDTFFHGTSEKKNRNFWLIKVKCKYLSRILKLGKKQWLRMMSIFKVIFCKVLWCLISNVFYGSVQKHQHNTCTGYRKKARATMILFPLFGKHSIDKSVFLTYWQSKPAIDRNRTEKKTEKKLCWTNSFIGGQSKSNYAHRKKHIHTSNNIHPKTHTERERSVSMW